MFFPTTNEHLSHVKLLYPDLPIRYFDTVWVALYVICSCLLIAWRGPAGVRVPDDAGTWHAGRICSFVRCR